MAQFSEFEQTGFGPLKSVDGPIQVCQDILLFPIITQSQGSQYGVSDAVFLWLWF